jgi:hypothetical protein
MAAVLQPRTQTLKAARADKRELHHRSKIIRNEN